MEESRDRRRNRMNFKSEMRKEKNGDLYATRKQEKNNVTVPTCPDPIGEQPEHHVVQIIKADKVKYLHKYLEDQLNQLSERKKKADEVIEQTKAFDNEKLVKAIQSLPTDKINKNQTAKLEIVAKNVMMNFEAKKNLPILQESIDELKHQIEFIEANYDL